MVQIIALNTSIESISTCCRTTLRHVPISFIECGIFMLESNIIDLRWFTRVTLDSHEMTSDKWEKKYNFLLDQTTFMSCFCLCLMHPFDYCYAWMHKTRAFRDRVAHLFWSVGIFLYVYKRSLTLLIISIMSNFRFSRRLSLYARWGFRFSQSSGSNH